MFDACCAVAEWVTGLDRSASRARVEALADRFFASVNQLCDDLGVAGEELDQVEGAVWLVASGALKAEESVAVTQFSGALRSIVCLVLERTTPRAEVAGIAANLAAASRSLAERSELEAARRREAEERARPDIESIERTQPTLPAQFEQEDGRSDEAPRQIVPEDWESVGVSPPVWRSRVYRSTINQTRLQDWCTEAVVTGHHSPQGMQYIVEARIGKGEWSSLIRGEKNADPAESFASLMRMLALVPDEGSVSTKAFVRERLPRSLWPEVVTLANRVPVGIPRFVASAWWPEDRGAVMSTPMMPTRRSALEALVHRIKRERVATPVDTQPHSVDSLRVLSGANIRPIEFRSHSGERGYWFTLRWKLSDGTVGNVQSEPRGTKKETLDDLLDKVREFERSAERDWKKVATSLLRSKALGEVSRVLFEAKETEDREQDGTFVCKLSLGSGAMVAGAPQTTKLEAVQSAVKNADALALKLGDSRGQNEAAVARKLREALANGRSRWVSKRDEMLKTKSHGASETAEIRDLTWLIALAEGTRAHEVPPKEAERLLRRVAEEQLVDASGVSILGARALASLLRSMSLNGVVVAGAAAATTVHFEDMCKTMGWDVKRMLRELEDRRLINVSGSKQIRFALAGEQLATKHLDEAVARGVGRMGDKFRR